MCNTNCNIIVCDTNVKYSDQRKEFKRKCPQISSLKRVEVKIGKIIFNIKFYIWCLGHKFNSDYSDQVNLAAPGLRRNDNMRI